MNTDDTKVETKSEDEIATTVVADGENQAEGTSETKREGGKAKKNLPLFDLESEKDEVEEVRRTAIKDTLPGYEELEKAIMADLESLKGRIVARNGSRIELDDANGKDIYEFDQRHRQGRTGKMPNGQSSFRLIASCKEISIDEKQCRRLADRWATIIEFRMLGVTEPRLGVSHYDAVKPLADLEAKLNALRDAEENNLTVAELREKYIKKSKTTPPKGWKEQLRSLAGGVSEELGIILDLMKKQGGSPDADVQTWVDDIVVAAYRFIPSAKEVA